MLVHRLQEFISSLILNPSLRADDVLLLDILAQEFSLLDAKSYLTAAQLRIVLQIFARRWESIASTPDGYDLDVGAINLEWVKLAQDLEAPTNRTALQILRPGVKNKRIHEFLSTLLSDPDLNSVDKLLLKNLDNEFCLLYPDTFLSAEMLNTVRRTFSERWKRIADTQDDYTICCNHVNSEWIKLAHDLEGPACVTYLQILMPSIQNTSDPNFWERHAASKRDLRSFFVGEDGKSLYRVWYFLDRMIANKKFATYNYKKYLPRPVSLREMLRIRSKSGDLSFELAGKKYTSFWDYLYQETIPNWHKHGEIPKHLLPLVLKVVEDYYQEISRALEPSAFRKALNILAEALLHAPIDDVNCLYGQKITINGREIFFVELFIDCFQCEPVLLYEQMAGVARWLCEYDATLVVDHCLLHDSVYANIEAGPAFNLENLQAVLKQLEFEASTKIHKQLKKLIELFAGEAAFDEVQFLSILDTIEEQNPCKLQQQLKKILEMPADVKKYNLSDYLYSLKRLDDEHSSTTQIQLRELTKQLTVKGGIDSDWINKLGKIYHRRWLKIQGTSNDYTRLQGKQNAQWIRLAQQLSGAGIIGKNYYRFLMPTLVHDRDSVTGEYLTIHPLSHYILSDSGRSLISLDVSALHFPTTKAFYNCNSIRRRPFSKKEIERLHYAHKKFHYYIRYADDSEKNDDEPTIMYTTLLQLKELVDNSLYADGLLQTHHYTEAQIDAAEIAYALFLKHYYQLPEEEKTRLDQQSIHFRGYRTTFAELRKQVEGGECTAVFALYIAQLVMDYAPYLRFREHIEHSKINVEAMRANSRKKIIRDYGQISEQEAVRRIQLLAVFIFNNNFTGLQGVRYEVFMGQFSNKIDSNAKAIFDIIFPLVISGNYDDACYVYAKIMATVARPAMLGKLWHESFWQKQPSTSWIHSLADTSLFQKVDAWYEPEFLFTALLPLTQKITPFRQTLLSFLDDLVLSFAQTQNSSIRAITINLKFIKLVGSFDMTGRDFLTEGLNIENVHLGELPFHIECAEYLIHRVASRGARAFTSSEERPIMYEQIKRSLEMHVLPGLTSTEQAFNKLNDIMVKFAHEVRDEMEHQGVVESMTSFLVGMKQRIAPLMVEQSTDVQHPKTQSIFVS